MRYVDLGKAVEDHKRARDDVDFQKKSGNGPGKISVVLIALAAIVILGIFFGKNVIALFDPISIVSSIVSPNLDETDGRTNILMLGADRRSVGEQKAVLTDTLLFISIGRVEKNVAMISLPRDLWVKVGGDEGTHFAKINSVYAIDGTDALLGVSQSVLGVPIHYYSVVDFELFKDIVDILGGIKVNVERSFYDEYFPVEGKESAPNIEDRYETVHFDGGMQTMDGVTALRYVRSRKGSDGEGTDFARSKRQQKVIMAIKEKVLSLETLVDPIKLKNLYGSYSQNVDTNMDFDAISGFYLLSQKIDIESVRSIVLDDRSGANEGGLLYHPSDSSLYGGAYVLVPRVGDFSQIHAYVQRYIFGE